MADGVYVQPMQHIDNAIPKVETPDMFGRMAQMAQIRNLMNQNAMFQQTFQAKQRAGQIMATAPDVQTGLSLLQKDPLTASFAPELLNSYRQLDLTNTQVQGAQQEMYSKGHKSVMKALSSGLTDQTSFDKSISAALAAQSPMTQQYFKDTGLVNHIRSALFDDLPAVDANDPASIERRNAVYKQRLNAQLLAADYTPEQIAQIGGKAEMLDTGDIQQPLVRQPGILGGGVTKSPGAITKGLAPSVHAESGVPLIITQQTVNQAMQQGQGAGNALGANAPTEQQQLPQIQAGDGKPLFSSPDDLKGPGQNKMPPGMNPTGLPILSPSQQEAAKELAQEHGDSGKHSYDNANGALFTLTQMDADLDHLVKSPNKWLTPGFAGKARTQMANLANTVSQLMAKKGEKLELPVPIKDVASAEALIKNTRYLGLQVLTTMLGNQREAAQTIQNITEAVPNIDNTYLGAKLLTETLRAQNQRVVDQRNWDNAWLQRNTNLIGSSEEFNRKHPPQDYANGILEKFGLTSKGFKDPEVIKALYQQGYLSKDEAIAAAEKQFGKTPPKAAPAKPAGGSPRSANVLGVE